MTMHIHYQERITIIKGYYILVVDSIMPFIEFQKSMFDEITLECLLNPVGTWYDNGVCSVTQAPLEHRIARVVSDANLNHELKEIKNTLPDDELIKLYQKQMNNLKTRYDFLKINT